MPSPPSLRDLEGIAAWWAAKQILPADKFAALLAWQKSKAFGLAQVWDQKLLEALYAALTAAIRDAQTLMEWRTEANKILAAFGGEVYTGEAFSSWYADLVFRMNVLAAYSAGRYAEMFSPEWLQKAPYWMFATAEDERVCEICGPLDGKVFRKDDEEARNLLPMLHFSCRCTVIEFDDIDVEAGGYAVSRRGDIQVVPAEGFNVDPTETLPIPIAPGRAA